MAVEVIEWAIEGYYAHGWEVVCTELTKQEARENLRLYRENEPGTAFRMKAVTTTIEEEE